MIVLLGAGGGIAAEPAPAQRLVPAPVLDSQVLDPNDGKHPIAGATYQKRPDMPVEHIAGPTSAITWRFEPVTPPLR